MPDRQESNRLCACDHCDLLHPEEQMQVVTIAEETINVCCTGCACAAQLIAFVEDAAKPATDFS